MVWFRENWYEEVLRQLRQALVKCRAVAFENRATVAEASVTPHTLNFVAKLVSTFGVGVENNVASVVTNTFSSAASESLARRAQATAQDPIFQRMKSQFTSDFDFRFGAFSLVVPSSSIRGLTASWTFFRHCVLSSDGSQRTIS